MQAISFKTFTGKFQKAGILIAVLLCFGVNSCDYINEPYGSQPVTQPPTEGVKRKVLLEDFTGHRCGNCPRAAENLKQIINAYPGQIVPMAVHVGFFASLLNPHYSTDFRTPIGNTIDQYYGNAGAGLPNGLVNRKIYNGSAIVQHTAWASKVAELLSLPPDADLKIDYQYNSATRFLSATAKVKALNNLDESLSLVFYLTEDNIIAYQKDYQASPSDIPDYNHSHVLRGSMNGAWGTDLGLPNLSAGDSAVLQSSITLAPQWNASEINIVAVLYRNSNREVIQAEEKRIQP